MFKTPVLPRGKRIAVFKLLIVDDDDIIRGSMARNVPWAQWGFEVAGLFEDGQNAIEFLEKNAVDAILTDVIMYEVSGIELSRYVRDHCPRTQVVILSGYREFEYVQEAMRYGVRNYVLKPIDLKELEAVFRQVGEELERRNKPDTANLPIIYFGEEAYAQIVELEDRAALAVASADENGLSLLNEKLRRSLDGAPANAQLYCLSNLLMKVYERINQAGISPVTVLPRENMVERMARMREETVLSEMLQLLMDLCVSVRVYRSTGSSVVDQAKRYIEEHLSDKITVDDIAHSVYLSSGYLSRAFRVQCGESLMDYVIRLRMRRAAALIAEGQHSIAQVALLSGYQDQAYFHRSFKKYTGCTVREYRARAQRHEGERP